MQREMNRNIRLGLFVAAGTVLLVLALYLIGNKQNLFGSTFTISAKFYNVNGLQKGNNVRFAGIDVGTVQSVEIVNDSSVNVVMVIEKNVQRFIKKSAVVNIGTDGLMGNKLVNINSGGNGTASVEEGDELKTIKPIEINDMVRTLTVTNENVKVITGNLRNITDKINSKNSLWSVLMDTVVSENVKAAIVNLRLMSNQSLMVTGNIKDLLGDIKRGKGMLGALITDTALSSKVRQVVVKLDRFSDTAATVSGDISQIVKGLKQGKGSIGVLLNDTTLISNLNKSMENIKSGSEGFNENMEALKVSWPFKKYFKRQTKSKKTSTKK
jgi:phospholipid/cholesterol/gamma-HCH transport system substrate-binding protein